MTVPRELLDTLRQRGVKLEVAGDRLRYAPAAAVTPDLADLLRQHKPALLAVLRAEAADGRKGGDSALAGAGQGGDPAPGCHAPAAPPAPSDALPLTAATTAGPGDDAAAAGRAAEALPPPLGVRQRGRRMDAGRNQFERRHRAGGMVQV